MTVQELGDLFGAIVEGDGEGLVKLARSLASATSSCVTVIDSVGDVGRFLASDAGAAWVAPRHAAACSGRTVLVVEDPARTFAASQRYLLAWDRVGPGIHPAIVVDATAEVHPGARVGPHVRIHAGAVVDDRAVLEDGAVIGVGACVGRGAIVRANAVVGDGARVGPRCEIGIGAVVGVDATVYLVSNTGWARHSGDAVVVLGEGVEIGPQTLVERGLVRDTYVGARTILGGQIYVGHDAEIGSDCLIMARCALGSDVRIGASTTIMACVSINPGVTIGAAAVIRGGSTVYSGVAERADVFGNPARPFFEGLFALGTPRRVKDLRRRVAELERAARTNKESRAARSSPSH